MVKNLFFLFMFLCFSVGINAQYFYKDIVSNFESAKQWNLYKTNKIKTIQIKSFFADNEVDEQFNITQKNNDAFTSSTTETKTEKEKQQQSYVIYNAANKVILSVDTTESNSASTVFTYDEKNRVKTITTTSKGLNESSNVESHVWFYDNDGTPTKMFLIKANKDTTIVKCTSDEEGNITEETHERKGKITANFLYYYDAEGNITDIVRFNEKLKKLLPDYIFEYNAKGQVSKMIQMEAAKAEYHTFIFQYNEKGLKIEEKVYFKNYTQMLGKLVYLYK